MKAALLVLAMLFLITACATTDNGDSSDSKVSYGGSFRVRGGASNNVHDGTQK